MSEYMLAITQKLMSLLLVRKLYAITAPTCTDYLTIELCCFKDSIYIAIGFSYRNRVCSIFQMWICQCICEQYTIVTTVWTQSEIVLQLNFDIPVVLDLLQCLS